MQIGLVGDVLVERPEPASAFDLVVEGLGALDVVFGNCEAPYCSDPEPAITAAVPIFPDPRNAEGLGVFDVMTLANNHSVDGGHRGLLETIDRLAAQGVRTVGAGADLQAARRPAVLVRDGVSVAFLGYASVFPMGFEARPDWPGIAPFRAEDRYRSGAPNYWYPGLAPQVTSVPLPEDLEALEADLAAASAAADVVVASFHWGVFGRPHLVTDHELTTARFCIDHGADVVVGHHHHTVRAVERYRGKPIYYGLGHFAFDMANPCWDDAASKSFADSYGLSAQPDWPLLQMHPDARCSMLALVGYAEGEITAHLVPCWLDPDGRVRAVRHDSDEGRRAVALIEASGASAGLATRLVVDEDVTFAGVPALALRS